MRLFNLRVFNFAVGAASIASGISILMVLYAAHTANRAHPHWPHDDGKGLPSTCIVGELAFATDAIAGQETYYCAATNTWTQLESGAGWYEVSTATIGAISIISGLILLYKEAR